MINNKARLELTEGAYFLYVTEGSEGSNEVIRHLPKPKRSS